MRRLLAILLISLSTSFMDAGFSKTSQTIDFSDSYTSVLEDISTRFAGYNYLEKEFNIKQTNIPNGFPLDIKGFTRISDYFGYRPVHPVYELPAYHNGIDFAGKRGTPVLASANGTVVEVTYSASYGKMIKIDHGNNVISIYAHLKKANVTKGQIVTLGEQIAELGSTGWSTGPHLHFEVRVGNKPIDPTLLLFNSNSRDQGTIVTEMCNQRALKNGNNIV